MSLSDVSSADQQPPVGIDLGTTYSVIAYLDPTGRPTTIFNQLGDLLTPSVLLFDDDGVIVGKEAVRSASLTPDRCLECFKRDMGSPYARRRIRNLEVPPEVLSAFVLEQLKQDAERRLNRPVRQVVITVPAFFDETRRKATQEAGRLAGLEVLDIINEPTAAALAYGYTQGFLKPGHGPMAAAPHRVAVYDLGGGTFDVTILAIEGAHFRALATDGDVWLGGKDFDQRLVNYLAEQFITAHGVDPRSDPQDAAQLWGDAMEAKHALSERSRTTVVCFHAGIRMRIEVTRAKFEELARDLLERTETTTSLVVKQAGLEWADIDRILLVGGSSRMPMVSQMLQKVTGKLPDRSQSPDEAVAHGAALYAGMLMSRQISGQLTCQLINVNSHSLGVVGLHQKTRQSTNVVLIPKNTPLPARAVRAFKTARADQRSVRVAVVEGESHRPEDCIALGECVVRDLPPGLPQGTLVEVEYAYADNGRLSVAARIPSIRYSRHVEIDHDQTRNLGDLNSWRERLRGLVNTPVQGFAAGEAVNLADRASVLKRLDALYVSIGRHTARMTLPDVLARSRQAALAAISELTCVQANVQDAERARQAAQGSAETLRADAQLAQARTELQQVQVRCDFALLVLGRECAQNGFYPTGLEREAQETQHLRKHLESGST